MNIQWTSVTWYSKMIALILFVALPFIGFYYGIQVGRAFQVRDDLSVLGNNNNSDYYSTVSTWQTNRNDAGGFSIAYPLDFDAQDNTRAVSADWRLNANGTMGIRTFTLTIPRAFEPQTNFIDATLTVGRSAAAAAVKNCLIADQSGGAAIATSTVMLGGASFTAYHADSAGAGNFYQTTSYRTVHGGQCYAVEYTIHSSQIANYPAEYNLHQFDNARVTSVLDRIAGTFKFL